MRDDEAQVWLGYELYGYPRDGSANEAISRMGRWVDDTHTSAYYVPLSQLAATASAQQIKLSSMRGASFGGEYGSIAAREHQSAREAAASVLATIHAVEGNVVSFIHAWVTRTYHELLFSGLQADLFSAAQANIDNQIVSLSRSALSKIERISERLRDGDPESVSQAMSTCRRLIDSAADTLFPPQDNSYQLGEIELNVRQNNVLNRLQAYVADHVNSAGRRDRLRRTLSDLYSRASSGTHSDVDVLEARYIFLSTYVVLGELLALRSPDESTG